MPFWISLDEDKKIGKGKGRALKKREQGKARRVSDSLLFTSAFALLLG